MVGTLDPQEMRELLAGHSFAHLGCEHDGHLYIVPISYVFDEDRIYGQTKAGRKIDMLRQNPRACVQVEEIANIANWKSVILWGQFQELKGPERVQAMTKLIDHLSPQIEELQGSRSPRDVTPGRADDQTQIDIVYQIKIDEMTGRFEREP
ncbi:MAG: pyridoxamine 5'-phosphate oxidase family protein [Armatimonadetes bacterium]|nr:pyridoxamine 5'-phosphate oxidase family protein [Armatimonadota bacterium]